MKLFERKTIWAFVYIAILFFTLSFSEISFAQEKAKDAESSSDAKTIDSAPASALVAPGQSIKAEDIQKVEDGLLQHYKTVYFAYGNPLTKAQFSFKSQIYSEIPVYMAYSQIIFWELSKDSKPFLDGTYNPEIFYSYKLGDGYLCSMDIGIWEHNSNGKGGLDSRSYDQSSLKFNAVFEGKKWITEFAAKIKYIYNNDDTNRDIYDYVSPFEFQIKVLNLFNSFLDRTEFAMDFHPGGKWGTNLDNSGYQFGLQFHIGGVKVVPAFYLQYYTGYAETLINYNERVNELRAGVAF